MNNNSPRLRVTKTSFCLKKLRALSAMISYLRGSIKLGAFWLIISLALSYTWSNFSPLL
jgi:hypothetical protein